MLALDDKGQLKVDKVGARSTVKGAGIVPCCGSWLRWSSVWLSWAADYLSAESARAASHYWRHALRLPLMGESGKDGLRAASTRGGMLRPSDMSIGWCQRWAASSGLDGSGCAYLRLVRPDLRQLPLFGTALVAAA